MIKFRTIHKYVSLAFAALWMMQALTGVLLVFHWELDDLSLDDVSSNDPARALSVPKLGSRIDALIVSREFGTPTAVYWSGGQAARFDVIVRHDEKADVLRVDGEGAILRRRPWNHDFAHIGPFQIITYLHQTLFADDIGKWFLGTSGLLLLSNIAIGLTLAWPRVGSWRGALRPRNSNLLAATVFAWHRALGLWLAVVACLAIGAGVLMAFENPLAAWFDDARPDPSSAAAAEPLRPVAIGTAEAITTALGRYPAAALTGIDLPDSDSPWFKVELRQAGELRRVSGRTMVYVSSRSGRILREYSAQNVPLKTRIWDAFYAVHTGEAGAWLGRVAVEIIGLWLLSMICLGLTLWWVRRRG